MDGWLTAGEGLVAASISVVGAAFTASANRRAQYDRVLTLVAESGSQPLANDRHLIGLRFEPAPKLTRGQVLVLSNDEIAALFPHAVAFRACRRPVQIFAPSDLLEEDNARAGVAAGLYRPDRAYLGELHRISHGERGGWIGGHGRL